jgi:hypothetical protein
MCLFFAAFGGWALAYQWRTGDLVDGAFDLFAIAHPRARRPLVWVSTVLLGFLIAFLVYAAVAL